MDLVKAAQNSATLLHRWSDTPSQRNPLGMVPDAVQDPLGISDGHILWMLNQIIREEVEGERAHRWLGYAQGMMAARGIATLEQLKCANLFA